MKLRFTKMILVALCIAATSSGLHAQSKRIIYFTNKGNNSYSLSNPASFLSNRALERRNKYGIKADSSDLPVSDFYLDSLLKLGNFYLLGKSRWLNAVLIQSDDLQIWERIRNISFVQKIEDAAMRVTNSLPNDKWKNEFLYPLEIPAGRTVNSNSSFQYGAGATQINLHNGSFLHRLGATGTPMLFSFMDAGYNGYLSNPFLDSARSQNRIIATKDFVSGDNNVNEDNQHGLNCLSITAGYKPGTFIGSCPDASFILLRTEDAASEYMIEEFNWAMGAEYADSCGTDVISSSLSYTTFDLPTQDHRYSDMDGNTTIISRAADMAAKKGILVATSAGNDGGSGWKYIGAPADADSVLTVGAVNASGIIAGFSSFGPTADKRIKPDVLGLGQGTVLSNASGGLSQASGTSFSTPLIAGLAACLWQLFPEMNNNQIIQTLRTASDRYANPQEQYGFGIPDMRKAVAILIAQLATVNASVSNCSVSIKWSSKDVSGMKYRIERKAPSENTFTPVHEIKSTGDVFAKRDYTYTEEQNGGDFIYRISQVIDTAVANQLMIPLDSALVSLPVICNEDQKDDAFIVYPNPAESELKIKFIRYKSEETLTLNILNTNGENLYEASLKKPAGMHIISIPVLQLQSGIYFLSIRKGKKSYGIKKFLKSEK